jgi:2-dehydro-3-deoxyphosphogluconate aldolase/(4S)-4-hydroxy-2-oxoglutarate aldolase
MTLERVQEQFAIPVLRHTDGAVLRQLVRALADGGLAVLEITLMSPAALEVIRESSAHPGLVIGAGTVLDARQAEEAMDAGAQFLVSPGLDEGAVAAAQKRGVPFIPGVMTPSEIMRARALGCTLVKLFPSGSLGGTDFLKNLRAPFPDTGFMCTGGVAPADIPTYLAAGAYAVGLGGQLTPADAIAKGEWATISNLARDCAAAVRRGRGQG